MVFGVANFIDDNIKQTIFLDVNFLDTLGDNTFEYFLYTLLTETLDLSAFTDKYKNKKVGRKAYSPVLLRVIFYAYYCGIISSRVIERMYKTDLKFMELAVGRSPHFTTIADFVSGNCEEMSTLFHKIRVRFRG
jgi:transposase